MPTTETRARFERIYERFASLLDERKCDVDDVPFRLVADAFMIGRRVAVEPFHD